MSQLLDDEFVSENRPPEDYSGYNHLMSWFYFLGLINILMGMYKLYTDPLNHWDTPGNWLFGILFTICGILCQRHNYIAAWVGVVAYILLGLFSLTWAGFTFRIIIVVWVSYSLIKSAISLPKK